MFKARLRFALLFVVIGAMSMSLTATASAAEATTTSTPGHVTVRGPHGGTAGWVSNGYLKAHPGAIPGVTVRPAPKNGVRPASASGCDLDVCIDVQGYSTIVDSWGTTAYGNTGCANAYFAYHEGYYVGPLVCPDGGGGGVYYDYTGPTGYFPDGDQLCNYWYNGPPGEPCEYIIA